MNIGNNIRLLRKERGLTQMQLAEKIGAGVHTLKMWESGKHEPSVGMVNKLCDALGVTADELCGVENVSQPVPYDFTVETNDRLRLIEKIIKMDDRKLKRLSQIISLIEEGDS